MLFAKCLPFCVDLTVSITGSYFQVYTTAGSELARVTVVNHDLEPVYEQLVLPSKPVIDYNTRFSGLTAKTLKGVTTTIKDVQNHLLHLFSEDTILVGHSLESDLVALKV